MLVIGESFSREFVQQLSGSREEILWVENSSFEDAKKMRMFRTSLYDMAGSICKSLNCRDQGIWLVLTFGIGIVTE